MSRSLRARNQVSLADISSPEPTVASDRPRRGASGQHKSYQEDIEDDEDDEESITVERLQPPKQQPSTSIKLKLKMNPSKLRESITNKNVSTDSRDSIESSDIGTGPRSSRARRQVIMESDSADDDDSGNEDEDDAEADDQDDEEDAEGDEDEEEEDDDDDAEGESDVEMEDAPPPPPIVRKTGTAAKPTITITSAPKSGKIKSVEAKEISMATGEDYDDDDLSDLTDDEDVIEEDALEGDEDADGDSFDDEDLSRSGTPDLSKMTKRQRAIVETSADDHFMALNMGPQTKLHLTDEQRNFRRVEMARRRKNLSEKRNEEEKQDTINRLLKKQAPKRRGKISAAEIAAGAETPDAPMTGVEEEFVRADPVFSRWVSGSKGIKLGLPSEWKDKALGAKFGSGGWRMVEEV